MFVDQAPSPGFSSINIDDRAGARAAAQHLVDLGHRRVGIIIANLAGPVRIVADPLATTDNHVIRQRMLGWYDALHAAGIEPTVVQEGWYYPREDSGRGSGEEAAGILLDQPDPPSAILCFSDVVAYGVVQAAHDRGLAVPADLSVVGFDDNPLAQRMRPALTTVRQDVAAKGHAAAAALTAAIERSREQVCDPHPSRAAANRADHPRQHCETHAGCCQVAAADSRDQPAAASDGAASSGPPRQIVEPGDSPGHRHHQRHRPA